MRNNFHPVSEWLKSALADCTWRHQQALHYNLSIPGILVGLLRQAPFARKLPPFCFIETRVPLKCSVLNRLSELHDIRGGL